MKKHIILGCFLALSLTACDDKKATNQATHFDNIISIGNGTEPSSLDPHKVNGVPEINIIRQMLEGLTSTDNDGKTIPGMAKSWDTKDNKTWVFHLKDAKWSNGDEVTADDFVYSFKRLIDPLTASPNSSSLVEIHVINAQQVLDGKLPATKLGITALNNKTLEIKLDKPIPHLPVMLAGVSTMPVNKKTIEAYGDKWTQPGNYVTNGAYNLYDWKVNDQIVLKKSSSYYNHANTSIDQIVFLPIESQIAEFNRFATGALDITSDVPSNQYDDIVKKYPNELKVYPSLCTYYYELNLTKPPFDDVRVRKALSLVTDRETFANKIAGRGEIASYQFTPTNMDNVDPYIPKWKGLSQHEKIKQATKLLADAGYNKNNPLQFELLYNTSENHKKYALAVSAMWKQAIPFINPVLNNQEWKVYLDSRQHQKTQMARAGACASYNEQSGFLDSFNSKSSGNYAKYNNPMYDALLASSLEPGIDTKKRSQIYKQAEALLDDDAVQINMYHYINARLVSTKVNNYSLLDPTDNFQVKYWSLNNSK